MTQSVREQFTEITKKALQQFVSDRVSDRLKSALAQEEAVKATSIAGEEKLEAPEVPALPTDDETHGFYMVSAILAQLVDPKRIIMRDQKSYCSVLLDDSNRKPICRLWFNAAQKYVGLFDLAKNETRMPIENLAAIYSLSNQLRETVQRYESKPEKAAVPAGS
jgi:predicted type IV restriction endonuclease